MICGHAGKMFGVIVQAQMQALKQKKTVSYGNDDAAIKMQSHPDDGFTKNFSGPGFVNMYAGAKPNKKD
jgi:hypothetical protein